MLRMRKEVLDYITTCERIQRLLAQGVALTADEREVIELCQGDLAYNIRSNAPSSFPGSATQQDAREAPPTE